MRKAAITSSEGQDFLDAIFKFSYSDPFTVDNCETYLKENLSGLFVSDLHKLIQSGSSDPQDVFRIEDTLDLIFSIDKEASDFIMSSFDNLKKFIRKILARLIRNENVLIDMIEDNVGLVMILDIFYGFILSFGKARNVDDFINVGKLRFNIHKDNSKCMDLAAFKAIVDKILLTEVSESLQMEALTSSYDKTSQFHVYATKHLNFINSKANCSLCATNSFFSCIINGEEENLFTSIFDASYDSLSSSQVIIEIQSSFMYKVSRFDFMQFRLLKFLVLKRFPEVQIYHNIFMDGFDEELDYLFNDYLEALDFDLSLYANIDTLRKIFDVVERVKKNIKQV